jgi:hypothetical protein
MHRALPRFALEFTCLLGLGTQVAAQAPPGWNAVAPLGADLPGSGSWAGGGLWAADRHGPPANLVDSLGLGNALVGSGFHLEGGLRLGRWDLAAELLGVRDPGGSAYLTLYRGHAAWRSQRNWYLGLEMEPLVWGYGLNGGYLLGQASRPFPRFRVESPMKELHVFKVPLGTWGFQAFLGRLENHRRLSDSIQNPLEQASTIAANGDPQAPLLSGYRVQARFSDFMEFYANYLTMWGGAVNGRSMLSGYGPGDYLTAMFGLKDTLAEANSAPGEVNNFEYRNKGRSSSSADVGFRIRSRPLERWLGARQVYGYVSRGSKYVYFNPGRLASNPGRYIWKDIETEFQRAVHVRLPAIWNASQRYTSPNLATPNDALGVLLAWSRFRLGVEYLDAVNATKPLTAVRPFQNYIYPTGFYTYGDPLGNALGGESRTLTVRMEADFRRDLAGATIVHWGTSPFRDDLDLWRQAHPGLVPAFDRFYGLQQSLTWRTGRGTTWTAGGSWERHSAVDYVPGNSRNGFRWFTDLSFRWPGQGR